jgi:hypothetical protein
VAFNFEQTALCRLRQYPLMSPAEWYLHNVDKCARLAEDATDPSERAEYLSDRDAWLQVLAEEMGTDVAALAAALDAESPLPG